MLCTFSALLPHAADIFCESPAFLTLPKNRVRLLVTLSGSCYVKTGSRKRMDTGARIESLDRPLFICSAPMMLL